MTEETNLPVLLVVEDDEGLQRQLKWAYDGYCVVAAGDRAQAIVDQWDQLIHRARMSCLERGEQVCDRLTGLRQWCRLQKVAEPISGGSQNWSKIES